MTLAAVLALPLGLWVGHTGRGRWLVTLANAARAVPSLGLLFAVAMFVGPRISSNLAFVIPSVVVLVLLAIPPLLSGADAGVRAVDPAARDAAYGMGMPGPEVLRGVELPCALPLLLSGVRSATLQVIAHRDDRRGGEPRRARALPHRRAGASVTTRRWPAGPSSSPRWPSPSTGCSPSLTRYAVSPGLSGKHRRLGLLHAPRARCSRLGPWLGNAQHGPDWK
jgi:osmoprotectant transport system permease protein